MTRTLFIFTLISSLISCNSSSENMEAQHSGELNLHPSLRISFPQASGSVLVNYQIFELKNDSLLVIDKLMNLGQLHRDSMYRFDTTGVYTINDMLSRELAKLIADTDSLGHHFPEGHYLPMGSPRFYIKASIESKELEGSISNCYRENIFRYIDFMNKIYPKGDVLKYDVDELLELEKNVSI